MEDLHKLAKERQLDELETAWMARLETERPGFDELLAVGDYVARRVDEGTASALLWALVNAAAEKLEPKAALRLARKAAECLPKDETLRQELAKRYAARYPEIEAIPALAKRAGILDDAPVGRACDTLDQWAGMTPGAYVCMRNSRRVARVEGFDAYDGRCVIRDGDGERALDLELAVREMELIAPDDLRALALFEKDRVKEMAENDPVGLIRLALSQAKDNRLDFRTLKMKLVPDVIPAQGWSAWWNKAKPRLKRAPFIEMSAGTQPTFVLRDEAVTYGAELTQRFAVAKTPDAAMKVALEFAREPDAAGDEKAALAQTLREGLTALAKKSPGCALGAAAVLAQLGEAVSDDGTLGEAAQLAASVEDLPDQLVALEDERVARRAAALVKRALPDAWEDVFEAALERSPVKRCDTFARELAAADPERMKEVAVRIAAAPDKHPEPFLYLWRAVARGAAPAGVELDREELTVSLLNLSRRLGQARAGEEEAIAKGLRSAIRTAISQGGFKEIDDILRNCRPETAERVKNNLHSNRGLTEDALNTLQKALQVGHPDLYHEHVEPWEDETVVWTTPEGLAKRKAEYDHLVHVEALENSRAIGEAAARGDLSENAEWTAAVEEQKLIGERARMMERELRIAHLIHPGFVDGKRVTVGSRVVVSDANTGEEATFTFLGPWDADIAKNIYSYKAPLSQAFMGKEPGEKVEAGEGEHRREFEVLSIESAL